MQYAWGSAVNCGLTDSCRYLKPDVMILGLGQGGGKARWRKDCDDGLKEIKSKTKLKP